MSSGEVRLFEIALGGIFDESRPVDRSPQTPHRSHADVQMARELGMNPRKLGKLDNHDQERWKLPLPAFIEHLYAKRFGKPPPEGVASVEEQARLIKRKREARRAARRLRSETTP